MFSGLQGGSSACPYLSWSVDSMMGYGQLAVPLSSQASLGAEHKVSPY